MIARRNPTEGAASSLLWRRFYCRRRTREVTQQEVCDCPYYFGKNTSSYRGDHKQYCDFDPDQDAVCFGFPERHNRYLRG